MMETTKKTRAYINKGEKPLFFDGLMVGDARIHDRVTDQTRAGLLALLARAETLVAPSQARSGIAEMVGLAQDEEQSFYRVLLVENIRDHQIVACLGFGAVSGCENTYDCFGVVAADQSAMDLAFDGLVCWLTKARARVLRFELDQASKYAQESLRQRPFSVEGTIPDFYADGQDQSIFVFRPSAQNSIT